MSIFTTLSHGALFVGAVAVTVVRFRPARKTATDPKPGSLPESENAPDNRKLAGQPLRILLSDRSGPGPALRDALMIRPSGKDH
jgi:hypothetical protein